MNDTSKNILSEKGYDVQKDQVTRIMRRLSNFSTVRCLDIEGRPIDPCKKGPDGGLDLIINIQARTPSAEKRIETMVLKILLKNDY
ncbi:hypothetical protein [Methylomagnum sp.]